MMCPKCNGTKVVTDRDLDPPHTCADCWFAFEDKDIPAQQNGDNSESNNDDSLVPDAIGEIIGWRAWYIVERASGVRLQSLGSGGSGTDTIWTPGEIEVAQCSYFGQRHVGATHDYRGNEIPFESQVPVEHCSCGFYAAVSREHLIELNYYHLYDVDHGLPKCIGQVAMAGKVIPGTQGWKAQQVWPVKLYVPYEFWRFVNPLKAAYNIPVELSRTLEKPLTRR